MFAPFLISILQNESGHFYSLSAFVRMNIMFVTNLSLIQAFMSYSTTSTTIFFNTIKKR